MCGEWLNWLTTIEASHLLFQVLVLHLEKLNLPLQIENDLLFGVHLQNGLVFNIHGSRGIIEGRNSLIEVRL